MRDKKPHRQPQAYKPIDVEQFKLHAAELVKVFMVLKAKVPRLRSDTLWETIRKNWYVSDLEHALKEVKRGKIGSFHKLIAGATTARANKDGFFDADGFKWGTKEVLRKKLRLSITTVYGRIEKYNLVPRRGTDRSGEQRDFYRLDQVESACADLLSLMNIRADENGLISIGDKCFGTIESLMAATGVSDDRLRRLIKKKRLVPLIGLDRGNKRQKFYSLTDIEDAKNPSCKIRPDGLVEIDGVLCGSMAALSNTLGAPKRTLQGCIKNGSPRKYHGIDRAGCKRTLYSIDEVREKYVTAYVEAPRAGLDGLFAHDGKHWGSQEALSEKLNVSVSVIKRRIVVNGLRGIDGRTRRGAVRLFYRLDEIRRPAPNEAAVRSRAGLAVVNAELLKFHAGALVRVLFALKKKMPGLRSDILWSVIKKKWHAPYLERALKKAKRGDLKAFHQLIAS